MIFTDLASDFSRLCHFCIFVYAMRQIGIRVKLLSVAHAIFGSPSD